MQLLRATAWASLLCLSAAAGPLQSIIRRGPVPYEVQTPPLDTDWTYKVGHNPWPEHPRPQLRRKVWKNLNGIWTFQEAHGPVDAANVPGGPLEREVLVPSCIESGLSGLQLLNVSRMWFSRSFTVPREWEGTSVILHFEAIDYESTVFINGRQIGSHVGGYFRFSLDITNTVRFGEANQMVVYVHDPTDTDVIPVGKQTKNPRHIWYRPCSGIWQTVWMESTPADHILRLDVDAGMDGTVTMNAHSSQRRGSRLEVEVRNRDGHVVARRKGNADSEFRFEVDNPELWEPSSPTLYDITVRMGDDEVHSYTGFRTVSKGLVNGVQRPLLNGQFVFMFGTLDQGYWPDGLYTPPSREAMIYDLKMLKSLGFNMVRKHIKVEPDLFYRACDEIGLMVVQDMPSMPDDINRLPNPDQQKEFQRQLEILVTEHKSYPSIVTWIIYNEGWGQLRMPPYPEAKLTDVVRDLDPTRLIDAVTGWFDHGYGDFSDNHHYASPQCGTSFYSIASSPYDPSRIGFQGEFGGIGHNVSADHLWKVQQAIDTINQTYEVSADLEAYNYRASVLFLELREQIEQHACSGGVWTQTSDVEGEVNGLYTYDRRVLRPYVQQWKDDIKLLYRAALARAGGRQ